MLSSEGVIPSLHVTPERPSLSDEALARQTQAGSLSAFEELVSRYERRIYAFIANSCRNPADAREVTQDTFVKAYQAIGQFKSQHAFCAWLFTIARRKCIDFHRAHPRQNEGALPEPAQTDDPAGLLAAREEHQQIWQVARRILPQPQFQALWLRYAEDLNIAQIARVLGKAAPHVRVLLFRARQALARALQPERVWPAADPECHAVENKPPLLFPAPKKPI